MSQCITHQIIQTEYGCGKAKMGKIGTCKVMKEKGQSDQFNFLSFKGRTTKEYERAPHSLHSFHYNELRRVCLRKIHWSFIPPHHTIIIEKYSFLPLSKLWWQWEIKVSAELAHKGTLSEPHSQFFFLYNQTEKQASFISEVVMGWRNWVQRKCALCVLVQNPVSSSMGGTRAWPGWPWCPPSRCPPG